MTETVQTHTHFLQRDKFYDTEKPYSLRFTPPEGFPRANIKLEKHNIKIRDIRDLSEHDRPSFQDDGCTLLDLRSKMEYEDFDDDEKVKEVYLREVADCLKGFLSAQHVQIFEHTVWTGAHHKLFCLVPWIALSCSATHGLIHPLTYRANFV
jgi:hypothetical protein